MHAWKNMTPGACSSSSALQWNLERLQLRLGERLRTLCYPGLEMLAHIKTG